MNTHHEALSLAILIRGSTDRRDEAMVQTSRHRMMRSNFVRRRPKWRLLAVRNNHPKPAMPIAIALAATECGANTTYRARPASAVRLLASAMRIRLKLSARGARMERVYRQTLTVDDKNCHAVNYYISSVQDFLAAKSAG